MKYEYLTGLIKAPASCGKGRARPWKEPHDEFGFGACCTIRIAWMELKEYEDASP